MSILLVTYDLKTPNRDYGPLYVALKQQGVWWHYLDSVWLIDTIKTPDQVYADIVKNITMDDRLFITAIKRPYWGYLPKDAWDWINQRLPFP
jgi:hypothetical protein